MIVHPVGIVFYGGWSLAKWFIEKKTQEKVHPVIYLSGVQQFIGDEYIPSYMVCRRRGLLLMISF